MACNDKNPLTEERMLNLVRSAVRKVDASGLRGVTLVTTEEIEALTCFAVCAGAVAREHLADRLREVTGAKAGAA